MKTCHPDWADPSKPWCVIDFDHTDGTRHTFTSGHHLKAGRRFSGFDASPPAVGDIAGAVRTAKAIAVKAMAIHSAQGTAHFTKHFHLKTKA